MHEHEHEHARDGRAAGQFPAGLDGLPDAVRSEVVDVGDGDSVELRVAPVAKQIEGERVRMLAYNGSIPGPTLRVRENSEIGVDVVNEGDLDATVHWHGLRLDNRYDGTHETQEPIPVGGSFSYRIAVPDPGVAGTTRTSARTTGGSWACTGTSSSSRPIPATGRRRTASFRSPSTTSSSRRGQWRRSTVPRPRTRRWAGSATCCSSAARPTFR